ncbi:MAG: DUF4868 domain-containing protein [Ktedonobacteraceae bacterium]|nr:DUF4868 domain-containing protein [Ktedonobacteraceae bacterium]
MPSMHNEPQEQPPATVLDFDEQANIARATLEQILNVDLAQCDLSVCLAAKDAYNAQPRLRRIDMTEKAAASFRDGLDQALASARKALRDQELRVLAFDPTQALDEHTVEYLQISSYKSLQPQVEYLKKAVDAENLRGYEHPFVDNLRFYSVIVKPQDPAFSEPIYYYRWYSHTFMLKDAPQFAVRLPFFGSGGGQPGTYDVIEEPVYLFDRHVDCISYNGQMFILQKYYFYTIFDLEEELKKIAEKALDELEDMNFIHNFAQFKFDCLKNRQKYRILSKVYLKPYFRDLSIDMLEPVIDDYERPIKIEWYGKKPNLKRKMLYSSSQPWEILHVLDDQFWTSPMTDIDYQARGGKNQIRKRTKSVKTIFGRRRK